MGLMKRLWLAEQEYQQEEQAIYDALTNESTMFHDPDPDEVAAREYAQHLEALGAKCEGKPQPWLTLPNEVLDRVAALTASPFVPQHLCAMALTCRELYLLLRSNLRELHAEHTHARRLCGRLYLVPPSLMHTVKGLDVLETNQGISACDLDTLFRWISCRFLSHFMSIQIRAADPASALSAIASAIHVGGLPNLRVIRVMGGAARLGFAAGVQSLAGVLGRLSCLEELALGRLDLVDLTPFWDALRAAGSVKARSGDLLPRLRVVSFAGVLHRCCSTLPPSAASAESVQAMIRSLANLRALTSLDLPDHLSDLNDALAALLCAIECEIVAGKLTALRELRIPSACLNVSRHRADIDDFVRRRREGGVGIDVIYDHPRTIHWMGQYW